MFFVCSMKIQADDPNYLRQRKYQVKRRSRCRRPTKLIQCNIFRRKLCWLRGFWVWFRVQCGSLISIAHEKHKCFKWARRIDNDMELTKKKHTTTARAPSTVPSTDTTELNRFFALARRSTAFLRLLSEIIFQQTLKMGFFVKLLQILYTAFVSFWMYRCFCC